MLEGGIKMRLKRSRILSFLLILALSLQLTGCLGIVEDMTPKPRDILLSLENTVQEYRKDDLLRLFMVDKGSSVYKEYSDILDLDPYTSDAAKCYKAVASGIDLKFDDADLESGSGITKVKVTFLIPEWKKIFEDSSISGADSIVEAIGKAGKNKIQMTLRLIDTKDGPKIKNAEDLMEIFDFVGYEIAGLSGVPDPSRETEPSESKPVEPTPTPAESAPKPTETEPSGSEGTAKPDGNSASDAFKQVLAKNKDGIEWFEKTFNTSSCGMSDFNGDGVPELYFFSRSTYNENYVNFSVFTYNPEKKRTTRIVLESLTQAGSNISEFFVAKTKDNRLITYTGYLTDGSSILNYNIYSSQGNSPLLFTGNLFGSTTPTFKDNEGKDFNANVFTATGIDKYKVNTSISREEYDRIEKDLLGSTEILISASFLKSETSSANKLMSKHKMSGISYADMLKKLSD